MKSIQINILYQEDGSVVIFLFNFYYILISVKSFELVQLLVSRFLMKYKNDFATCVLTIVFNRAYYLRSKILSTNVADEVQILNVDVTEIAHDKDINSVSVSPNDRLIATGSQDKTAKVSFVAVITDSMEQSPLERLRHLAGQLLSKGSLTCSQKPPPRILS